MGNHFLMRERNRSGIAVFDYACNLLHHIDFTYSQPSQFSNEWTPWITSHHLTPVLSFIYCFLFSAIWWAVYNKAKQTCQKLLPQDHFMSEVSMHGMCGVCRSVAMCALCVILHWCVQWCLWLRRFLVRMYDCYIAASIKTLAPFGAWCVCA